MLPWQTNSILVISTISLQKPSNLDITGFPALFHFVVATMLPGANLRISTQFHEQTV